MLSEPPLPAGLGLPATGASCKRSGPVGPCKEAAVSTGQLCPLQSCVHFHGHGTFFRHCLRDVGVSSWDYFCFPIAGD